MKWSNNIFWIIFTPTPTSNTRICLYIKRYIYWSEKNLKGKKKCIIGFDLKLMHVKDNFIDIAFHGFKF